MPRRGLPCKQTTRLRRCRLPGPGFEVDSSAVWQAKEFIEVSMLPADIVQVARYLLQNIQVGPMADVVKLKRTVPSLSKLSAEESGVVQMPERWLPTSSLNSIKEQAGKVTAG
ncbi:hypothetical protein [Buchananella hordeovulneris]|uniref:hypothetical protein n=1 Tax=Buchananella hordeovulneris TaxID=52770 RepID=UPI0026DD8EFA|nr:hypothetical protein [Buchananella hordeovulneris]MDO5079865.1 hypothetical protein [Buchananella hordeovulneris]